jgi:formamidopyrimidine-DNA glycosylase
MPELPDVTVYVEALAARLVGQPLVGIRIANPFVLRTVSPSVREVIGAKVVLVRRMGKRIVIELEGERFIVIHLMKAGRFRWHESASPPPSKTSSARAQAPPKEDAPSAPPGAKIPGKLGLAAFDFPNGTLLLTEAGSKRRASIHMVAGAANVAVLHAGGVEPFECDAKAFRGVLTRENHTLKRALTDPHLFSGIGNAYSDEILHRAHLSPVRLTSQLTEAEALRLFEATNATLREWTDRLRADAKGGFPEKVTAFRDDMAVHGKFGKACPVCGSKVQRIVYAENETNYCATCQTGGKLLADRALSRLLRGDWPKSIDEMEEFKSERRQGAG